MIAVDTSTFVEYLNGSSGTDIDMLSQAFTDNILVLPPPVLTELLSYPLLPRNIKNDILLLPLIPWEQARLADALISYCCIHHEIPLITRDKDFKHYEKFFELDVYWK